MSDNKEAMIVCLFCDCCWKNAEREVVDVGS